MIDWQPIETAPKDRRILLYIPTHGPAFGAWADEPYHSKPQPHFSVAELKKYRGTRWMRENQPTHWAEVPAGPGEGND